MPTYETPDEKWSAVISRDRKAASAFVFSVTTTGIYCRPNCGARQPRKVNVKFFTDSEAATQAGYRACKRCRPELEYWDPVNDMIAKACGIIRSHASQGIEISLAELASQCDVTKFYLHRTFKKVTGQTPKDFARMCCRVISDAGEEHPGSPQSTILTNWQDLTSECLALDDVELYNGLASDLVLPPDDALSSSRLVSDFNTTWVYTLPAAESTCVTSFEDGGYSSGHFMRPLEEACDGEQASSTNAPIWYMLKHIRIGMILIAYRHETICALKMGMSSSELVADLQTHFYPSYIYEINFADEKIDPRIKSITTDILEALERPSGKTIILPFGDNILV